MATSHVRNAANSIPPRMVAIDVDGTLLNSRHELDPETISAVQHARTRGVEILLSSSRPPRAMWAYLRDLGLLSPSSFVGSQGGIIGQFEIDGKLSITRRQPIAIDLAKEAAILASSVGCAVNWFSGSRWLVSHIDDGVEQEARIVGLDPEVQDLLAQSVPPEKLLLIAPGAEGDFDNFVARLPEGLLVQTSNPAYVEITLAGVDKASAVAWHAGERRYTSDEVVAIGDGHNDLGMFGYAGTSVAPANARPRVMAAATYSTDSNDDHGVAVALRALIP